MGKRIFRTFVVLGFFAFIFITVQKMPHMETDASHELLTDSTQQGELSYNSMSDKELFVLAYDGDANACYQLGVRYDYGVYGTAQNFASALEWYRAADAYGQPKASAALGYLYLNGCGVDKDVEQARAYFEKAVALTDSEGYVGIGRIALESLESEDNAANEAFESFKAASDSGNLDGIFYLGYVYEKGIGTAENCKEALKLYRQVIEDESDNVEYSYAKHEAYTRIGIMALNGKIKDVSEDEARAYIQTAADDGYAKACYYMGIIYEQGIGVSSNYDTALNWFEAAARDDYAPALNEIGYMYFNGLGVTSDYEQALYYQKLSAALGFEKAQINLGFLYENGYGVEKDLGTALSYYEMAEQNGYPGAEEAIARVISLKNAGNETEEQAQ